MADIDDDGFGSDVDAYVEEEQDEDELDLARRRSSRSALAAKADQFLRKYSASIESAGTSGARRPLSTGGGAEGAAAYAHGVDFSQRKSDPSNSAGLSKDVAGQQALREADSNRPIQREHGDNFALFAGRPRVSDASSGSGQQRRISDAESVRRDKERLQRFAMEAASFLDKAYENDVSLIVEDDTDNRPPGVRSNDDFRRKRRIELDKARLERFSREAEALIDRAYSDDPTYFVTEEVLSPSSSAIPVSSGDRTNEGVPGNRRLRRFTVDKDVNSNSVKQDKQMLQQFHTDAMSFLNVAAQPNTAESLGRNDANDSSGFLRRNSTRRVQRDKERLEQHYREAMAFLEKAEKGEGIIEERELECGALDRIRLRLYAEEAMAYLEKAFAQDESFDVDDEEFVDSPKVGNVAGRERAPPLPPLPSESNPVSREAMIDALAARALAAREARLAGLNGDSASTTGATDNDQGTGQSDIYDDEEAQIAADRAAMERYYDVDDFGEDAIVEETLSDTSGGTDRGLFARRVGASSSDNAADDEWDDYNLSTDDEYQDNDPSVASSVDGLPTGHGRAQRRAYAPDVISQVESIRVGAVNEEVDVPNNDRLNSLRSDPEKMPHGFTDNQSAPYKMERPQIAAKLQADRQFASNLPEQLPARGNEPVSQADENARRFVTPVVGALPHVPGSDVPVAEDKPKPRRRMSVAFAEPSATRSSEPVPSAQPDKDVLVELLLEGADLNGKGSEWSEVPLEKSFYRQVPRGASIKLRSRSSRGGAGFASLGLASLNSQAASESVAERQYQAEVARVARERDVVMSALEEIVNERSQMAAQISDMKATIASTFGQARVTAHAADAGDIDVAAELKESYAEFAALIRESEATVNVLEGHIQEKESAIAELEARCDRQAAEIESLQTQSRASDQVRAELDATSRALERAKNDKDALQLRVSQIEAEFELERSETSSRNQELDSQVSSLESKLEDLRKENEDLKLKVESMEKEKNELTRASKENRSSAAQSSGNVMLWSQLSEARSEAEEAHKAQARAERQLAEMKARVNSFATEDAARRSRETQEEHEKALEMLRAEKDGELLELRTELGLLKEAHQTTKSEDRGEVRQLRADLNQKSTELEDVRNKLESIEFESKTSRGALSRASEEIAELKSALVQASTGQEGKIAAALNRVEELEAELKMRERQLQMQIDDAVGRAAAAEDRAAHARTQLAELEDSSTAALEEERRLRKMVEDQRDALERETRVLEQLQDEREKASMEIQAEVAPAPPPAELAPSSSKRGIRKSSSKAHIAKKKGAGRAASTSPSEDGSDAPSDSKKRSHRLRFFG